METKDKIIAKQDEYIAYLTKAIKSESIIEAVTCGIRSNYESELSRLKDEREPESNELYPCPYSIAVRCTMVDPCLGCETWAKYKAGEEISRLKSEGEDSNALNPDVKGQNFPNDYVKTDYTKPAEQSDKLTAEDVLKDFISKCRDYSCYSSDINKKRYSFTVAQLCELMEAYHSQFVGEKVTNEMIEAFEEKVSKKRKGYYCSICHDNPVDAENGYDTCQECLSKQ
jgi:hypothetical protein